MPNCTATRIEFPAFKRHTSEAQFNGGAITSDGGTVFLRTLDKRLMLTGQIAVGMPDGRIPDRVQYQIVDLLRQRVYGLVCGYEDLNDHETLHTDIAFQTAVENDQALGSRANLCRLEQWAERVHIRQVHEELLS